MFFSSDKSKEYTQKKKVMSDVVSSHRTFPSLKPSVSGARSQKNLSSVPSRNRGVDGIRTERTDFIQQMKRRSFRDSFWRFWRKSELYVRFVRLTVARFTPNIAPHKMLYGSLIGGVVFGVVSMGFIEHFFGPGVFVRASDSEVISLIATEIPRETIVDKTIFDANTSEEGENNGSDVFFEYFNEAADEKYRDNIREMVKGYPIEAMLPYIFEQDRMTSSFLIGIAKKESNWGKRVPVLDDQDCFNYWGYRGVRRLMGTGGHTCFNSRQDAVATVAKRINTLTQSEALNTPEKMIIWKCGFSCSGHSRESVKKWIADVDMYFSLAGGDEDDIPLE